MSLNIDEKWIPSSIAIPNRTLEGYRREGAGINEDYPFMTRHLKAVASEGGVLFRHEHDSKVIGESVDPFGNTNYQLGPTGTDIWYLPQCSFEDSLKLLDAFDFPEPDACKDPGEVRRLSKSLLLDLSETRLIAMLSITSDSLYVERVGPGAEFTTEEMTRVLDFNQTHFGTKHSKSFLRDLRKHYRQKGFFVLGKG